MAGYAHPEVLVETDWLDDDRRSGKHKIVEVDVDTRAYDEGHIPGAIAFDWQNELQDRIRRDIPTQGAFEALLGRSGIRETDTVLLYGDSNNWFAAHAFWIFKIYGHADVRLVNGGRKKWLSEGREMTTEAPKVTPARSRRSRRTSRFARFATTCSMGSASRGVRSSTCARPRSSPAT